MGILADHRVCFTYSFLGGKRARRKQRRFLRKALQACSYDITRAPVRVTIRFTWSGRFTFQYDPAKREIRIPRWLVATRASRRLFRPIFIHEVGHAIDHQYLRYADRYAFFVAATGFHPDAVTDWSGTQIPFTFNATGSWIDHRWHMSLAEMWADTFLVGFSNFPPNPHAWPITDGLVALCKELVP